MATGKTVRLFTVGRAAGMNGTRGVISLAVASPERRRFLQVARTAAWLAGAAAGAGCASLNLTQPAADLARTPYRPALFQADAPNGASLTLFGTVHVGRREFYPLPDAVRAALEQSGRVAVEIDVTQRWGALVEAFRPRVRLPFGRTLSDLVSPALLARVRTYFAYPDGVWADLQSLQPWWIANFRFATAADRRLGGQDGLGVERHILEHAHRSSTPVIELESVQEQVEGLAGGTFDEQRAQFEHWFELVQRRGGLMNELLPAWKRGDLTAIAELKSDIWGGPQHLTSLRRRFFTERDERMADRLALASAADPRPLFAAVGAYHLAGDDSLLAGLAKRGFRVARIDEPNSA